MSAMLPIQETFILVKSKEKAVAPGRMETSTWVSIRTTSVKDVEFILGHMVVRMKVSGQMGCFMEKASTLLQTVESMKVITQGTSVMVKALSLGQTVVSTMECGEMV